MKIDPSNVVFGVILFATGLLCGNILQFQLNELGKFTEIISSVVSICGLFIALCALNTWKHQFFYNEKHRILNELEKNYRDTLKKFYRYRYIYLSMARNGSSQSQILNTLEFREYAEALCGYREIWSLAFSYLKDIREFENILNSQILEKSLIKLIVPLSHIYENTYRVELDNFENKIDELLTQGIKSLNNLRKYS